jgi:hypothetical protein
MLVAKKIIAANLIVGGAIVVAAGTAAIDFAMSDPNCRDKIQDCSDRMRDCANRLCNRSSDNGDPEMANSTSN